MLGSHDHILHVSRMLNTTKAVPRMRMLVLMTLQHVHTYATVTALQLHMQYQLGLTKSSTSEISEVDVSVPSQGMEGSSHTVAVEADAHADYEQD